MPYFSPPPTLANGQERHIISHRILRNPSLFENEGEILLQEFLQEFLPYLPLHKVTTVHQSYITPLASHAEMEAEDLLQQLQDYLEDDDDEILAFQLLQQLKSTTDQLMATSREHGGSRPGKRCNIDRDRFAGHQRMYKDYFAAEPTYSDLLFRRRFRMRRDLFLRIMSAVSAYDSYFTQKRDATGLLGLSTIQKTTAAMRMLAYGLAADATDEYCRLGESTAIKCFKRFVRAIRVLFESQYLRQPTKEEIAKQMEINRKRGFPGMFASLDCMHYEWKNCPVAWQGQFGDKDGNRSIILEAVADQSLHIWHAFFGLPGANNDLNVLERSPLVRRLLAGPAEDIKFQVNDTEYPRYYLLTDGIYPKWAIFQQSIHNPTGEKKKFYAKMQEACRKDVERAFGVLQGRFAVIANPSRLWKMSHITDVLYCCVILHNMIVEDESDLQLEPLSNPEPAPALRRRLTPLQFLDGSLEIEDVSAHYSLRNDIIEHLWQMRGNSDAFDS